MKIYEIGTGYTPIPAQMGAATEIVVEELTKAFLKLGQQVEIIDIASGDRAETDLPIREVPVPGCFRGTDVKLGILHKLKRVVYSVCLAQTLKKLLKDTREQVVLHFHNQYNLYFFLKLIKPAYRRNVKIAYTVHSYIWHNPWIKIHESIYKRYFQEVFCIEHANDVFVLNEQTRINIVDNLHVNPEKIHLIGNGVNTDIYYPFGSNKKVENKQKWNFQDNSVFIQVGSVCDRKNQFGALRKLLPLMKKREDIIFCYAGGIIDQDYHEQIQAFARENGISDRVKYMGELKPGEMLNDFYNSAEAMIFQSKAEGFSLVILEAMSAGIPVIIDQKLKFEMADCCISGEESELESIIIQNILNEEMRYNHSKKARKTIEKGYSWLKIAESYLLILAR